MIRWYKKASGEVVLQEAKTIQGEIVEYDEWHDVPTEVEKPESCRHESDGSVYLSDPPQYRCVKCFKFYGVPKPEPRKPREWWVKANKNTFWTLGDEVCDFQPKHGDGNRWIKVREVLDDDSSCRKCGFTQ